MYRNETSSLMSRRSFDLLLNVTPNRDEKAKIKLGSKFPTIQYIFPSNNNLMNQRLKKKKKKSIYLFHEAIQLSLKVSSASH